jgi:hypothetical protein
MKNNHIDLIRDAALLLEKNHLNVASELMLLAFEERPNGPFIKKKVDEYNSRTQGTEEELELNRMLANGEVVIIPAGFRCQTKGDLFKSLNFKQPSMPFDSGFFPPESIANIIQKGSINLKYPDTGLTHTVCIKNEYYTDKEVGCGIKFEKSTYTEINQLAVSREMKGMNRYLDSTFEYYTLDMENNFVLAHYNWHEFSEESKSKGIYDIEANIKNINDTLNKRIERMFDVCDRAKYVFFVVGEFQKYQYMMIDDKTFDLNDFEKLSFIANKRFNNKCFVTPFSEVDTAEKLLSIIK